MPVQEQVPYTEYTGNGVTTTFAYTFKLLQQQDLTVLLDGIEQIGGYSVDGIGSDAGGNVIFSSPPGSGVVIGLQLEVVLERETDYIENGDLRAQVQDDDFDRIWEALQSQKWALNGAIRVPFPEVVQPLPKSSSRLDRMLMFDEITGKPVLTDFTATEVASAIAAAYAGSSGPLDALTFIQAGVGAVPRSAQNKVREIVSVKDYGALGNGTTDDTAAIQAAENYLASAGGGTVLFPRGMYKVTSTLTKRASNVLWLGEGHGQQHDAGSGDDYASALTWAGAAGGTMIDFAPATGASARRISGGGVVRMGLYGRGVAAIGLSAKSMTCAEIDIYIEDFTSQGLITGVVSPLGESADFRENRIRVYGKQVNAGSGNIARFDGTNAANTCYNTIDVRGLYKNAAAVVMGSTDNNWITQWTFRFGGGTGRGLDLLGGATAQWTCRANIWAQCYAGEGGITARGTGDYAVASYSNVILSWDSDNVQPNPTIGTGATLIWYGSDGAASFTDVGANRPVPNQWGFYGAGGAYLMKLNYTAGANSFFNVGHGTDTLSLQAAGAGANIALGITTKGTGIGALYGNNFAVSPIRWSSVGCGFQGTAPIAKPTVTGAKGGNAALASLLTALASYGLITDSSS